MTPEWLNDAVRAFGRQMGLRTFELNERGAAGVRFENGLELKFEYETGYLALLVTVPLPDGPTRTDAVLRVLQAAHPDQRRSVRLRSGVFARDGRAFFHARLPERDVAVDALERAFRELWTAATSVGRAA